MKLGNLGEEFWGFEVGSEERIERAMAGSEKLVHLTNVCLGFSDFGG